MAKNGKTKNEGRYLQATRICKRFLSDCLIIFIAVLAIKPLMDSKQNIVFAEELSDNTEDTVEVSSEVASPEEPSTEVASPEVASPEEPSTEVASPTYTKTFTISAYYSPLPCQNRYVTGSYEGDIKLNGRGVRGADGTNVYAGMIAAPKTYQFGTKMDIPGVGIVAVHDRGGAIRATNGQPGVYDRLDIWMGYGDKGLNRALKWGKRTLDVVIYDINEAISEQIVLDDYSAEEANPQCNVVASDEPSQPEIAVADIEVPDNKKDDAQGPVESKPEIKAIENQNADTSYPLAQDLRFGNNGNEVEKLQKELKVLNFYRGEITAYYGQLTEHAVFKFQQAQFLVADKTSLGAGIFGPKTRDRMNEIISSRKYNTTLVAKATQNYEKTILARRKNILLASNLSYGMTGPEVAKLQKFLKNNGFFEGRLFTEYFGPVTKSAVVKFQKANNLIGSDSDSKAGVVDGATLELINVLS